MNWNIRKYKSKYFLVFIVDYKWFLQTMMFFRLKQTTFFVSKRIQIKIDCWLQCYLNAHSEMAINFWHKNIGFRYIFVFIQRILMSTKIWISRCTTMVLRRLLQYEPTVSNVALGSFNCVHIKENHISFSIFRL